MRCTVVVVISLAVATPAARADTWFVDAAIANPGDGRSWSGAFQFLQDALHEFDLAAGDAIHVAAGTYLPDRYAGSQNGSAGSTGS